MAIPFEIQRNVSVEQNVTISNNITIIIMGIIKSCVHGHDTQISQCLFQPSNVNGYQKNSQETEKTKFASKLLSKVQPYTQGNTQTKVYSCFVNWAML